jgi:hypothetical protein
MSTKQQIYRPSPPPIYNVTTPSGTENEIHIDDTSLVGKGRYCVKERQSERNTCGQIFRFIRSNFF